MPFSPTANAPANLLNLALNKRIGTAIFTADVTAASYSSQAQVTGETLTVSLVAGYTYRVTYWFTMSAVSTADYFIVRIRDASGTGGSQLNYCNAYSVAAGRYNMFCIMADYTASVTGNITFGITAERVGSGGNGQFRGATTNPRSLVVDYVSGA